MIPSQMLKGVLEACVLEIIKKRETYAYEISTQLKEYGFGDISEGTIYPIILRLQKNELVESTTRESSAGPKRKYYHLTDKGILTLSEFKNNWIELNNAVSNLFSSEEK